MLGYAASRLTQSTLGAAGLPGRDMPEPSSIAALAERLRSLVGWRARLAAFAAGALSVLAMAPFFLWPVLWITLPALVWLIDGTLRRHAEGHADRRPARRLAAAAETGWWWGFGYFLAGLHWIGEAFLVEAEVFAVFMPFAVMLMPAGLALFYAAATAAAATVWKSGAWRVVALALSLSAMEWLRGHVLTGFPWNVLGYALTSPVELMQSAAVLGIYGLTLAAVLVFGLPAVLWSEAGAGRGRLRWAALAVALLPLLAAGALGRARLAYATSDTVPGVKIRIVQPSVPQREKWRPENWARFFQDHLDLSGRNPAGVADNLAGITHVVWPEAAMPFPPLDTPEALAAIGGLLPEGTVLIAGATRIEWSPGAQRRPRRFFNSLMVFGKGGLLLSLYDKIHLVPFGEYLPRVLRPLLAMIGMQQLAGRAGFDSGVSPRPILAIPGLPGVVPLICYEAIFPAAVVQRPEQGGESGPERRWPTLIVNLTNDGWFGNTTGPRQHLHQARVRAVEEGLPLIRAANNGVSAAFDAYGRPLGQLDLNVRGVIDVPLTVALPPPPYARLGDTLFLAAWLSGIVLLTGVVWRQ
jgi:apolipoprotein N-acyltransferase